MSPPSALPPPPRVTQGCALAQLTSWPYSKKTKKLWSRRRVGWAARRCRKTSCIATVFLKIARYSLQKIAGSSRALLGSDYPAPFPFRSPGVRSQGLQLAIGDEILGLSGQGGGGGGAGASSQTRKGNSTHASSSCFILANSSRVMELSPSPNFCSFSLEASKSGLGGAGGICSKEGQSWPVPHC